MADPETKELIAEVRKLTAELKKQNDAGLCLRCQRKLHPDPVKEAKERREFQIGAICVAVLFLIIIFGVHQIALKYGWIHTGNPPLP